MLKGTLDDFTLADVLRLVAGARRTGGLAVARDAGAGSLYFRDGAVSRGVARYARRAEASTPTRAAEDLAFDLTRWGGGEFTWTPGAEAPAGPDATVDVEELLKEVSRRLAELAEIRTLVPSEEAVLTMAPQPPEGAVQINITPAEWRVLVLVDGHRTVTEVAEAAHVDDLEAMKLLYGLAAAGLVTAGEHTPSSEQVSDMSDMSDTTPEAVDVEPEPVPEPEPFVAAEPEPDPFEAADLESLVAAAPEPMAELDPDPFLAELSTEPLSPFDDVPPAPLEPDEAPSVDRSTAARELAGLFDEGNGHSTLGGAVVDPTRVLGGMTMAGPPAPPMGGIRRVEDDDQVTRGLISRLIDGVKGL